MYGYDVCRHQDRAVNLDDIDYFYSQSANERVPCDALPDINLQPWVEAPPAPPVSYGEPRQAPASAPAPEPLLPVENFLSLVAPDQRQLVFRKHAGNRGLRS